MYRFHIQENPFKTTHKDYEFEGLTLREAYEETAPKLPIEQVVFVVNDEVVKDLDYIPIDGDLVVAKYVPADDTMGPGSISFWSGLGVMALGLILAFTGVGAVATPFLLKVGAGLAVTGWLTGLTYELSLSEFDDETQNPSLYGSSNSSKRWNPIPIIYGEHLLTPEMIAPDWTELKGDDADPITYLRQLYILGPQQPEYGHELIVDRISIGDSRVFDSEVMFLNGSITKLSATTASLAYNSSTDYSNFKKYLPSNPVGLRLSIEGSRRPQNNRVFKILSATNTLITFACDDFVATDGNVNLELKYLKDTKVFTDIQADIITDGEFAGTAYPKVVFETALRQDLKSGVDALPFTTPENTTSATVVITAPSGLYSLNKKGQKQKTSVYVKVYAKHIDDTAWTYKDTVKIENENTPKERKKQVNIIFPSAGQWLLKFEKTTTDFTSEEGINNVTVTSITCDKKDINGNKIKPVRDELKTDFAFLALNVKATDQLNGTISNLNTILRRQVRAYDNISGEWVPSYSNNPASIFVDILVNDTINKNPIFKGNVWSNKQSIPIDWDMIEYWYEYCEEEGLSCNGVLASESTVKAELEAVAVTGQAIFTMRDGLYTVYIDEPKTPVQLFTPRNTNGFSATRTFFEVPDGIKVKFIDEFAGYQANEVVVDYENSQKEVYDEVELKYITSRAMAKRFGRYWLNVKMARQEYFSFSTDIEYMVCTAGDRIRFQHDVPLFGMLAGRVSSVTMVGNQITGVTTDESLTYDSTKSYAIELRVASGNGFVLKTLPVQTLVDPVETTVISNVIQFVTPQPKDSIQRHDLFAFGISELVTEDLMITEIGTGEDLSATITGVKYDEAIYSADGFTYWDSHIGQPASGKQSVYIPNREERSINSIVGEFTGVSGNKVFVDTTPTTPYQIGDIWKSGVQMFVAIMGRSSSETFNASDWQLTTSETWQMKAEETFGVPFPEHRWYMNTGTFPILEVLGMTVDSEIGGNVKENMLYDDSASDDATFWESAHGQGSVHITPNGTFIDKVVAKTGLKQTSTLYGRYGKSAWHGEGFTNLITNPDSPSNQSISLTVGQYILQTYEGEVSCDYGVASQFNPLMFDIESNETVTFTMSNAKYVSLTKTMFIPPYVKGSYTANVTEIDLDAGDFTISGNAIVNNRLDTPATIAQFYISDDEYISFGVENDEFYLQRGGGGQTPVVTDGLVKWFPFDTPVADFETAEGATAVDVTLATVEGRGAYVFNGTTSKLNIPDIGSSPKSYSVMVYVEEGDFTVNNVIMVHNTTKMALKLSINGTRLEPSACGDTGNLQRQKVVDYFTYGQWNNIVGIYRGGSNIDVYINDNLLGSVGTFSCVSTYGSDLCVGYCHDTNLMPDYFYYKGAVADLRFYDRVLAPEEVSIITQMETVGIKDKCPIPQQYLTTNDLPFQLSYDADTGDVELVCGNYSHTFLATTPPSAPPTKLYLGSLHDGSEPLNNQVYLLDY